MGEMWLEGRSAGVEARSNFCEDFGHEPGQFRGGVSEAMLDHRNQRYFEWLAGKLTDEDWAEYVAGFHHGYHC